MFVKKAVISTALRGASEERKEQRRHKRGQVQSSVKFQKQTLHKGKKIGKRVLGKTKETEPQRVYQLEANSPEEAGTCAIVAVVVNKRNRHRLAPF
jgi:hypothetical protein